MLHENFALRTQGDFRGGMYKVNGREEGREAGRPKGRKKRRRKMRMREE